MNILYLGPDRPDVQHFMESFGDLVKRLETPITPDTDAVVWADFIVSFGYRHIVPRPVLEMFPEAAINLHISYLPYNRGADPNLWSFLEDTPKGVSIHYMSPEVDTGRVIIQRLVKMSLDDTLKTSYDKLIQAMKELFQEHWPRIRVGDCNSFPQPEGGSSHRTKDKERFKHWLTRGWDTPVHELIGIAHAVEREQ